MNFLNLSFNEKGKLTSYKHGEELYFSTSDLWRVNYEVSGEKHSIEIDDCTSFNSIKRGDCLILQWENNLFVVEVTVFGTDIGTSWDISVQSKEKENKISSVVFPIIHGMETLKKTDDDCLLLPYQGGWLIYNPTLEFVKNDSVDKVPFWLGRGGKKYEAEYPASLNFQFTSYSSNNIGCYLSTDDPDAHIKTYRYLSKNEEFLFELENYPEGMGKTTSYCMPYRVLIAFYHGGWQESVDIYRKWALNQKWCRDTLKEKGIKQSVVNTDLWRINHTNYALGTRTKEYFETSKRIKEEIDCNLGLHWYGWNMGEHDVNYPQYISEQKLAENWAQELKTWNTKFSQENIVKMPYVNARLWDHYNKLWEEENALSSALKAEGGSTYYEPWKEDRLIPMCPATYQWQKKVVDFSSKYVNDYSFDGIYLDQIAAFNATLCFDENHPHPVGGGTWWNDRYHDMIKSIIYNVGNEKIITSESCCETYIDVFDMFLILDSNIEYKGYFNIMLDNSFAEPIPLFNMIYGKHSLSYGSVCRKSDPIELFEYKLIKNLLWGFIPTIEGFSLEEIDSPDIEIYFAAIKKCVGFFKENKSNFLYGRICRIPDIKCGETPLTFDNDVTHKKYYPEIIGALWESEDNEKFYLFYNTSNYVKKFKADGRYYEIPPKEISVIKYEI